MAGALFPACARSFVALGECMVELAPEGGDLYRAGYAGDSFNAAWYARRLLPEAWTVGYGTCVGTDPVSDAMLDFMTRQGIETRSVRRVPDRTVGLYMIRLGDAGERNFAYWRGQSAARLLAEDGRWLDAVLAGCGVALFSGITLAILAPPARERLCRALARARRRAPAWPSTRMSARISGRAPEGARRTSGRCGHGGPGAAQLRRGARALRRCHPAGHDRPVPGAGARMVVVKSGAAPVEAWSAETGPVRFGPPRVADPVDTTAAGDSFAAAVLTALARGSPLHEAVPCGMALAAHVIQHRGALVTPAAPGAGLTAPLRHGTLARPERRPR